LEVVVVVVSITPAPCTVNVPETAASRSPETAKGSEK
jgi:hypothetical protein